MKITIIGGGNLGCLMGASFSNKGHEVTIQTSRPCDFSNDMEVYDANDNFLFKGKIANYTNSWQESIPEADLVWITVPPQLFKKTAEEMLPYVHKNQLIGVVPGAGAAEFAFIDLIRKGVDFFGLARVPSIARIKEKGKSVYMLGPAPELVVGSIPSFNAPEICKFIQPLYDMNCRSAANYLNVAFTPSNPVLHTSRLYAMFRDYLPGNIYPRNELFYEEWTIDGAEVLLTVSDELQDLCKALPMDMRDVESMQKRHNIRTPEELAARICSLDRLKGLYSPVIKNEKGYIPDFSSRYFISDFPFGIKIMIEVAKLFNVDTPMMNAIWNWYEKVQPDNAKKSFKLNMNQEEFIDFYMN